MFSRRHRLALAAIALSALPLPACHHPAATPAKPSPCPAHSFAIAGACLAEDDAQDYCGPAAKPEGGGCVPQGCEAPEPMDVGSGSCVPVLALRKLAKGVHTDPKATAPLACSAEGDALVVEGTSFRCLPREATCGRGSSFKEGACHPDPACPPGSLAEDSGACVAVVHPNGKEPLLDVGAWVRLAVGSDGSEGRRAVCALLQQRPWLASVVAHGKGVVDVEVSVVFPDNDVREARVTATATRQSTGGDVPGAPIALGKQFDPLWKALQALGGVANAASATTVVHCPIDGGGDAVSSSPDAKGDAAAAPQVHPGKPAS